MWGDQATANPMFAGRNGVTATPSARSQGTQAASDPNSPNVQWGALHYGPGRILNRPGPHSPDKPNVGVSAVAQSTTMSVFVWVEHPTSSGDNLIYIDQVGLKQDSSAPVAPVALPTPTDAPATDTPIPAAPPVRVAATAIVLPTETPTPAPTFTPTPSPSPTPTDTPTATTTPTDIPYNFPYFLY